MTVGLVLIVFGNVNQTFAQGAKIGFRFLPTFTSIKINTPDDETLKGKFTMGYGFEGLVGLYVSDHVGFQGEVMYNTLSQKYSKADFGGTIKLNYVNIPLLLSLNTGIQKPVNLSFVAGPQIGLNVGSKVEQTGDNTYEALLRVRDSDIGLAYGVGLDFGLNEEKTTRLGIGFRGVVGLVDISDNSGTTQTDSYYILKKTNLNTYSGYIGLSFLF